MTATDERAAGTELTQVAPGTLAYTMATDPGQKWDLAKLAAELGGDAVPPVEAPKVKTTEPVRITPELRAALKRLPEVFGSVAPTEPRLLEQAEVDRLTVERDVISAVTTALGQRDKDIDETMRHHYDALADKLGMDVPVIAEGVAKGHKLLATEGNPFSVAVNGFADAWQQRRVRGKADMSLGVLTDLRDQGKITQKEFLSLTSSVRVLDEAKIKAAMRKSPGRVLQILRAITLRKGDTAQLVPPKK